MMSAQTWLANWESIGLYWLIIWTLAATAVWAGATVLAVCLSRHSAQARHRVWVLSMIVVLIAPLVAPYLPVPRWWKWSNERADNRIVDARQPSHVLAVERPADAKQNRSAIAPSNEHPPATNHLPVADSRLVMPPPSSVETAESRPTIDETWPRPISWRSALIAVWLGGAALSFFVFATGLWRIWLLRRRAVSLTDGAEIKSCRELCRLLVIRRNVKLLVAPQAQVPFLAGIFDAAIVIPSGYGRWVPERLRFVLTHELLHLKRNDVLWEIIAQLAMVPAWFHPLGWLATRRLRVERELACDDAVLLSGELPADYAEQLVEVAAELRSRAWIPVPVVMMAGASPIERRVRSILDPRVWRAPLGRWRRVGISLGMAGLVLAVATLSPSIGDDRPASPAVAAAPPSAESKAAVSKPAASKPDYDDGGNQPTKGGIRVRVVDADGRPLGGTKIHAGVWTKDEKFKANRDYESNANGLVDVKLPDTLYILRLWAKKHGYVYQSKGWEKDPPAKRQRVPEEFAFHMLTGTVIAGFVTDEDGKPIPGVKVEVMRGEFDWLNEDDDTKTDSQGHWMIDTAPPGDDFEVRVIATHPDYISLRSYYDSSLEKPLPIKELRAQTATTVMKRGIRLTGTITTSDGKPVTGALAIWGDQPYFEHRPQQEVHSDEHGVYRFPPLPPGPMRITVVGKGWMPEMRNIEISTATPVVDFRLKPGKTLRIRFVDPSGAPVSKLLMQIHTWRGAESLYNYEHPNVLESNIPRHPDKNGVYEWTWAPDDAVTFQISAIGDFSAPEATFIADDQEHIFTLQRPLQIAGRVTDVKTGRPIEKYTIAPVLDFGSNLFEVLRPDAKQQGGGKYSFRELDRTDVAYRLRIEADGYRSAMSPPFRVGDTKTTYDFRLEPAPAASGRILEAGKPIKGAKVYLATRTQSLERTNDEGDSNNNYCVITTERGEFSFPAQFERYKVMAMHDDGYAEAALRPDQVPGDLTLKKWTRVEGRLLQAGKPVADADVRLWLMDSSRFGDLPYIRNHQYAKTDVAGRFVFARVPPVKCTVAAELGPWRDYPITSSQHVPLDLQPGQQVTLNLGGEGAQVTGRVKLKGEHATDFDLNWSLNHLLRKTPGIEPPEEIRGFGFDWRRGWSDAWTETMEGQAYLSTLHHDFVKLNRDGTFSINGVPAGDYELALKIYEHEDPKACLVNPVATNVVKFRVTESDVSKNALDLGSIEVDAALGPKLGEIVPDFEFETLDGAKKKLSELRGQYVLLDFWTTWCGSCVAALPEVQQLAEKYRSDGRLAVLSMSLDADGNAARRFVQEHKLAGTHGLLGDWPATQVPTRLGISSLPTYLLIGADGKLILKAYSTEQITEKLRELLMATHSSAK
jgi:beta-lactamase regulating signal transducer with metallopeptidase domain/thiol-disulfide isomerase/thioredoxin/protocatechuate 3,4-dioxygenase beta subunit